MPSRALFSLSAPGAALVHRGLAMGTDRVTPRSRRSGKGLIGAVVGVALLAVLGFAAYKILFNRPGEAAAAYLPADAQVVITLDLTPSDRQLETFDKITKALDDQGIADRMDGFLKDMFSKDPLGAEIRPHLKRNFAMAMWPSGKDSGGVGLLAIDDPGAVRKALDGSSKPSADGIYKFDKAGEMYLSVLDEYLVIGSSAKMIQRVQAVRAGKESAVSGLPAFVEARASLPKDANLMVFLSTKVFEEMSKETGMMFMGGNPFRGSDWMAYSATVEPDGLAFDYHFPFDAKKVPALAGLSKMAPFSMDTLKGLPEGAYGLMGISQSGLYYDWITEAATSAPGAKADFDKAVAEFEKQFGISVLDDIVPALKGEQVLACYPGPTGEGLDLDVALVATNANGATPAALAEKVRASIERESAKSNQPVKFTETKIGDVTVWEIDAKAREEMVNGIYGGMSPMPMPTEPSGMSPNMMQEMPPSGMTPENKEPAVVAKYKDKTALYAVFPDKVVVTSSHALLNKMIAVQQGGRSLADVPAYKNMQALVLDGSQSVVMVDVRQIMEKVKASTEEGMKGAPVTGDDFVKLFGDGKVGMVASGAYDGKVTRGRLFFPLDWEQLVRMIGKGMKGMSGGPDMGAMPDMGAPPSAVPETITK